jgi:hypothetical protein
MKHSEQPWRARQHIYLKKYINFQIKLVVG